MTASRKSKSRTPKDAAALQERVRVLEAALASCEKALERVRCSEDRLSLAVQGSNDGLWVWDGSPEGAAWWSPRYYELLGFKEGDVDADFIALQDRLHPADRDRVLEAVRAHLDDHEPYDVEYRLRMRCGAYRWFHARGQAAWDDRGRPLRMAGSLRDITDRKRTEEELRQVREDLERRVHERTAQLAQTVGQLEEEIAERERAHEALRESENRYRTFIQTIPHGVLEVDTTGAVLVSNCAFDQMLGLEVDPGGCAIGRDGPAAKSTQRQAAADLLRDAVERHAPPHYLTRYGTPDGRLLDVQVDWSDKRDEDGRLLGYVAIITDVTDRKRAEEQAYQHREELAHVLRLATMGEMATGLAHELNQPLAAISNYGLFCQTKMHKSPGVDASVLEAVEEIARQAERAGEIIRRMRAFVYKQEIRRSTLLINELVEQTLAFMRHELLQSEASVATDLTPAQPAFFGDSVQIQQVLINLIRNGLDAMSHLAQGNKILRIRTEVGDGQSLQVSVEDRGIGLIPEVQRRLFEPFYTTKPDGMGMGLPISRTIVEAHGGRLWAKATEGGGATFCMTLPATGCGGSQK